MSTLRLLWSSRGSIAPSDVVARAAPKADGPTRKSSRPVCVRYKVLALELRPVLFRLAWVLVICTHLLCGLFFLIKAGTYWYLMDPIMGYYVHLWSPTTGNLHYDLYAMIFGLICCLHLIRVLQLVYFSIRECGLAFKRTTKAAITPVRLLATSSPKRNTPQLSGWTRLIIASESQC